MPIGAPLSDSVTASALETASVKESGTPLVPAMDAGDTTGGPDEVFASAGSSAVTLGVPSPVSES